MGQDQEPPLVRVAAVGDLHLAGKTVGRFRDSFQRLSGYADVLLLAGDLTRSGAPVQAHLVASEIADVDIPILAVLGNHDHQSGCPSEVSEILTAAGVRVLEGDGTVLPVRGIRLGVAGCTGFGGGFDGSGAVEAPDPAATRFQKALAGIDCDVRVALTHYAPVPGTLAGEPVRLYPRLGSCLLGAAIDSTQVVLAVHGHAHHGVERAVSPGGVPVRNVAYPVIRTAYRIYRLRSSGGVGGAESGSGTGAALVG